MLKHYSKTCCHYFFFLSELYTPQGSAGYPVLTTPCSDGLGGGSISEFPSASQSGATLDEDCSKQELAPMTTTSDEGGKDKFANAVDCVS